MFVIIQNGIVTDALRVEPASIYPPAYASQFIAAPDGVGVGWSYDGSEFTAPAGPSLADQRATKVLQIKAERDRRKFNGVHVSGKWIHTDNYSRLQWVAMVIMAANVPVVDWTTMDGSTVPTSQALAGQVFLAVAQLDVDLHDYAKSLIVQIEASNEPQSVDIATGWPATFGEAQ